jgi:hypothetical protein
MAGRISYYGGIVTNGLVLALDAAKRDSYPGSGTTWNDISGNRNNGTLTNGPTFDAGNGGSIVFDGVDDYVVTGDIPFRLGNTFSINFYIYWDNIERNNISLLGKRNGNPFNQYVFYIGSGNPYIGGLGKTLTFFARRDINGNNTNDIILTYLFPSAGIYNICLSMDVLTQNLYINGVLNNTTNRNNTGQTFNITNRNLIIGSVLNDANNGILSPFLGNIYQTLIYNRALSATEILQNYNATKGRYGL